MKAKSRRIGLEFSFSRDRGIRPTDTTNAVLKTLYVVCQKPLPIDRVNLADGIIDKTVSMAFRYAGAKLRSNLRDVPLQRAVSGRRPADRVPLSLPQRGAAHSLKFRPTKLALRNECCADRSEAIRSSRVLLTRNR